MIFIKSFRRTCQRSDVHLAWHFEAQLCQVHSGHFWSTVNLCQCWWHQSILKNHQSIEHLPLFLRDLPIFALGCLCLKHGLGGNPYGLRLKRFRAGHMHKLQTRSLRPRKRTRLCLPRGFPHFLHLPDLLARNVKYAPDFWKTSPSQLFCR